MSEQATKSAQREEPLNKGTMFLEDDGTLTGRININGETFRCKMAKGESGDRETYALTGDSPSGDNVESAPALYVNEPATSANNTPKPEVTGTMRTTVSRLDMRFAGWWKQGKAKKFLSINVTENDRG